MRALVTGGAGFIGSALVRRLFARGWDHVAVLDKLTYAANPMSLQELYEDKHFQFYKADVCDRSAFGHALSEQRPNVVFHLAAETHVDRSIDAPGDFIATNIVGAHTILEACRAYWRRNAETPDFRLIHVSTDEVFGSLGADGMFTEDSPYAPSSPYAASKAAADHLARAWRRTFDLPVIVTNCSNNYGPRQFPEKLIPLMILKALSGEPLPVYGAGDQIRDWLHVDDHADALIDIAERGQLGDTYAIGARCEKRNLDVVQHICRTMDARRSAQAPHAQLITHVEDRPGHDQRYAIDPSRLEHALNWRPSRTFEHGLADTVDWYLENENWWRSILSGAYRGERLGLGEVAAP
ncbi:MAG: dTDP-glucose 4,6-dehydratase [Pseudomonadota bacterium]